MSGRTPSGFEFVRKLGGGSSGQVWLARDRRRERSVAIKVFDAAIALDRESLAALQRVHECVARIEHPAILGMQAMLVEEGAAFLVMDYAARGDAGALRGARWDVVVSTLLPIANALAELHRAGIVHRDVKTTNVLRMADGGARLSDFGAAALIGERTSRGLSPGSRYTMSPEALDGGAPCASNDVYGFGAMLYEMLSGYPPFYPHVTPERIRHEVPERIAARRSIPEAVQQAVVSCLQKSAADRPPSMERVGAQLECALEELAASTP